MIEPSVTLTRIEDAKKALTALRRIRTTVASWGVPNDKDFSRIEALLSKLAKREVKVIKRYSVLVTREATESCSVEVEADSVEEAEELALGKAESDGKWETDDANDPKPYICDPGNCAQEVEGDA